MARSDEPGLVDICAVAAAPQVRLHGPICDETLTAFRQQLNEAEQGSGPIAVELMTMGGDADLGRRLALEIRLARTRMARRLVFVGKTAVYSAGTTIMGGFPVADRYLTRDTVLLLHCRQMEKTMELRGPLESSRIQLEQALAEVEVGQNLEREGFAAIVDGSDVGLEEICERAQTAWYVQAPEALERRLVAGLV